MIDQRILEILKTPDSIEEKDLSTLQSNIRKYPYVQSLRALFLYGTHRFQQENYEQELSTTAAYTTDKKILYQFINRKKFGSEEQKIPESTISESEQPIKSAYDIHYETIKSEPEHSKTIYINGERNRILFEGEEDFLNQPSENIDLEATLESGQIVTSETQKEVLPTDKTADISDSQTEFYEVEPLQEIEKEEEKIEFSEAKDAEDFTREEIVPQDSSIETETDIEDSSKNSFEEVEPFIAEENAISEVSYSENIVEKTDFQETESLQETIKEEEKTEFPEAKDAENFSTEEIIPEDSIREEEQQIEDPAALSFHGTEDFLPNVKMEIKNPEPAYEVPKPKLSRHEEEMQRLIAEVEAKMKANRKPKPEKQMEDEPSNFDINFVESHDEVPEEKTETNLPRNQKNPTVAEETKVEKPTVESQPEVISEKPKTNWKPMNFQSNTPDYVINEPEKKPEPKSTDSLPKPEIQKSAETHQTEERPVMNVSFFKEESSITPEKPREEKIQEAATETVSETKTEEKTSSNIPQFINTWQSWLKLDHGTKIPLASKVAEEIQEETEEPETEVHAEPEFQHENVEEIKQKAIEKFIETEPKISKLKEESEFIIKEKSGDISHLMTETLAKIYAEQRLYSKAIKAYEILKGKHPEKSVFYDERIQEIKDLRSNTK